MSAGAQPTFSSVVTGLEMSFPNSLADWFLLSSASRKHFSRVTRTMKGGVVLLLVPAGAVANGTGGCELFRPPAVSLASGIAGGSHGNDRRPRTPGALETTSAANAYFQSLCSAP